MSAAADERGDTQRRIVVRFYFDVIGDYPKLYEFIPHNAMVLYDAFDAEFASSPRAFTAACFTLAQKMYDVQVISTVELVELFGATANEIISVERDVFARLVQVSLPMMPETRLLVMLDDDVTLDRANVLRFFNLALFEDYPNDVRADASVHAFFKWTKQAADDGLRRSVIECADRLMYLATNQLGPVFADSPLLASA